MADSPASAPRAQLTGRDEELRELIEDVYGAALNLDLMVKRAQVQLPALRAPHRAMCVGTLRLVYDVLRGVAAMLERDRAEARRHA